MSKKLFKQILLLIGVLAVSGCGTVPSTPTSAPSQTVVAPSPVSVTATVAVTSIPSPTEGTSGPLFVNPDNRRYFTDGVKVNGKYRSIYLTGAHTWCNFIDCGNTNPPVKFDYKKYLDFVQSHNYNFFRLWRAENARGGEAGPDFWFAPMPYERSDQCCAFDGGNKFDLEKFNQSYFDRMRERILEAGNRGIYVSIMLFDGWSVESKQGGHVPWPGHPYNKENNINGINGDLNENGQGEETHILTDTPVTALQEAYVRKVIDTVDDLNNVLYEISNESPGDNPSTPEMDGSKNWQYHMIGVIRDYEKTKPKQHPIGMTWEWLNGSNQVLLDSPADWISPGGALDLKTYEPAPTTGAANSKVILADTDHLCGICGNVQWVWKSFTRGENPVFMDFYNNDATGRGAPFDHPEAEAIRTQLTYARSYATRINLTEMTPQPKLCSTGYCLANASADKAEYLVFLPAGEEMSNLLMRLGINKRLLVYLPSDSKVVVDLSAAQGNLSVEWFNPATGEKIQGEAVSGGTAVPFNAPFTGNAVLYIHASSQ